MIHELVFRHLSLWDCVWQSTFFTAFGLAGSFLMRRRPARASRVLFIAIIAAVLLPALSVLVSYFGLGLLVEAPIMLQSFEAKLPEGEVPMETPKVLLSPELHSVEVAAPTVEFTVPTEFDAVKNNLWDVEIPWRSIALYGWMTTTLFLLGRLIVAFVGGIRLLLRAQTDHCEHIRTAADSARARLGIIKDLEIRSSKNVRSPMIWCWSRPPVLLMPDDLDDQIDWVGVICHELAHWRRWDHISGFLAELAVRILPWNPLLWWSKKLMVRLSEQACDDWVLVGGRAGTDYAQSLLNLSPELQMAFLPTVIGKEKPMKKRIYRIVKEKCGLPQVGARWALAVTVIATILTVGVALAQRRPARFERIERDERIAAEQRERHALEERGVDLENRIHGLRSRLEQVGAELAELEESGRGESDEAQAHRNELHELEEAIASVERQLQELEGELRGREMRPGADQEPRREMLRRLEELGHETEMVLQALAGQDFGRNEEAGMLYGKMRELNEQMQQIRQQFGRQFESPGRQRPEYRRVAPPEEKMLQLEELGEKARQIERELEELGDENPERAEKLHAELREIHEAIAQIERDLDTSRGRGGMYQRGLQEHAHELERRLQEIGDAHPDEAQELRMQLDQIHQQMERIEREPGTWPRSEEPMQPEPELRHRQLIARREQLRAQLRESELVLNELNEQGKADSEEAQMHRQQLREFAEQLKATENELRELNPDRFQERDRDDLEREVRDLRKQMNGMNEQMSEMRELIKRLLEKGESPEDR